MGARLAALLLAWLAGVALQLQRRELFALVAYGGITLAGTASVAIAWRWRRLFVLALAGLVGLGFAAAGLRSR